MYVVFCTLDAFPSLDSYTSHIMLMTFHLTLFTFSLRGRPPVFNGSSFQKRLTTPNKNKNWPRKKVKQVFQGIFLFAVHIIFYIENALFVVNVDVWDQSEQKISQVQKKVSAPMNWVEKVV